ncbi:MAG: hypothetical protein Tsb0020_11540 [Haliangiales bacterium]
MASTRRARSAGAGHTSARQAVSMASESNKLIANFKVYRLYLPVMKYRVGASPAKHYRMWVGARK